MREAEYAATMASLADGNYAYPKEVSRHLALRPVLTVSQRIDAAWEDLLLCQFHDVLPGSGIALVRRHIAL